MTIIKKSIVRRVACASILPLFEVKRGKKQRKSSLQYILQREIGRYQVQKINYR